MSVIRRELLCWQHFHLSLRRSLSDQQPFSRRKLEFERKWGSYVIDQEGARARRPGGDVKYVLSMFPYPSGNLHMGHVRVYTISDVLARFYRYCGFNVIHPMGWDAFGLPAENAARERSLEPQVWTLNNIESMRRQMKMLACSFDWEREVCTCDPSYYKWTQFLFIKLLEAGLAYQKKAAVNWDPVDETVLANEQVDEDGLSWRSGAKVERRYLKQWFINVSPYCERLYNDLSSLSHWDATAVTVQGNWIGKPAGCRLNLTLSHGKATCPPDDSVLTVHIKNPEYIAAAAFVTIPSGHYLDDESLIDSRCPTTNDKKLKVCVWNPFSASPTALPVYVSDRVEYVCDNHLGIPLLSASDKDFATSHHVPYATDIYSSLCTEVLECGDVHALALSELGDAVCAAAKRLGIGGDKVSGHLMDWLISRQRRWGTPIPIIHCPECGAVPVPYEDLPVGLSPPGASPPHTSCPRCGGDASRETDTMDTFVDSSWYYLRYLDPNNPDKLVSPAQARPVDVYIGGIEHAHAHLYYARFIHKFIRDHLIHDLHPEPFHTFLPQGNVLAKAYHVKSSGNYIPHSAVLESDDGKTLTEKATGLDVTVRWQKMSKSKCNGIDPLDIIKEYGVDSTRLFIMADVPAMSIRQWDDRSFTTMINFQYFLYNTVRRYCELMSGHIRVDKPTDLSPDWEENVRKVRNIFISASTYWLIGMFQFNVTIWKLQAFVKFLKSCMKSQCLQSVEVEKSVSSMIIILSIFAPHLSSELWSMLCSTPRKLSPCCDWSVPLFSQKWPEIDESYKYQLITSLPGTKLDTELLFVAKPVFDEIKTWDDAFQVISDNSEINKKIFTGLLEESNVENMSLTTQFHPYWTYKRLNIKTKDRKEKLKKGRK